MGLPVMTPFPVGETVSMEWDSGSIPDIPGNYSVGVAVPNGPTTSYVLTDVVTVEVNSWGTMKALYR